jgi:hypothetical protein
MLAPRLILLVGAIRSSLLCLTGAWLTALGLNQSFGAKVGANFGLKTIFVSFMVALL